MKYYWAFRCLLRYFGHDLEPVSECSWDYICTRCGVRKETWPR